MNYNALRSDFTKNFCPNEKFRGFSVFHTNLRASFVLFISVTVNFLDTVYNWLTSYDTIAVTACSLTSEISLTSLDQWICHFFGGGVDTAFSVFQKAIVYLFVQLNSTFFLRNFVYVSIMSPYVGRYL